MIDDFKIVFMGTPEFAVHSLDNIIKHGIRVEAVITAPDKPAGRGRRLQSSAVKIFAEDAGLKIMQPKNLKDQKFHEELRSLDASLFVVVAFRMLPEIVWSMPAHGTINLHASLLPNYRGAAPINWAIINGEKETGVTTFFIEKQIDTGKIIQQEKVEIDNEMTAGDLHDVLARVGSSLVVNTIESIKEGTAKPVAQEELDSPPSKAPKIYKEDCEVDWNQNYEKVYNFIRGLSPYPTAWSKLKGEETNIIKIIEVTKDGEAHQFTPGSIVTDNKNYLRVAAIEGWIYLKEIIPQGKKKMNIKSFLNGNEIRADYAFI